MKKIDEVMGAVKSAVILGHVKPDGDCVGSCMGLAAYLKDNYGISADVFLDPFSASLDFLTNEAVLNPQRAEDTCYDMAFVLDSSDEGRIGAGKERLAYAGKTVCIDHHISNPGYGDVCVVEPHTSSACEVLYGLMDESRLTRQSAMCLYTGMVHDTGVFQYSNTSPLTMSRAGYLMSFGFDHAAIISASFYEKSFSHQKLLGDAVSRAEYTEDGRGVWSCASLADMERTGSNPMETEGIVETLRNTSGIDYSIFVYETEPGAYKASFRSKNLTDVSRVAKAFGGGGHIRAAGCSFSEMTVEEFIRKAVEEARKQRND